MAMLIDHFWKRWKQEYLTSLREFHQAKGKNVKGKIQVGDVVQVHDDGQRLKWKLAVVENLISGRDNQVRAVELRTATGKTNRPITKELNNTAWESLPTQTGCTFLLRCCYVSLSLG